MLSAPPCAPDWNTPARRRSTRQRAVFAPPPRDEDTRAFGLSKREREVLHLLAQGHSNRAIADQLFIAEATVKVHVTAIFTKLGVDSRSAATAFAIRNGLA